MNSSKRKIASSRANGARAKGAKTPEGIQRSSYNAIRHGLLAKTVVLATEDPDAFEEFLQQFVRRFEPLDDVEFGMIEEMASAQWRIRRNWAIETELMDQAIDRHPPGKNGERTAIAAGFSDLAAKPELPLLHRYEARLHRIYQRALRNLLDLRANAKSKEVTPAEPAETENFQTTPIPIPNTALKLISTDSNSPVPIPPRLRVSASKPRHELHDTRLLD